MQPHPVLATGLDLAFAAGEAGTAALGDGWARPGSDGVASIGHRTVVTIEVPPGAWLLELELRARLAPPALAAQVVALFADGAPLGRDCIDSGETMTLGYPLARPPGRCVLEIRLPEAPEARALGHGGRARVGIILHRLRLVRMEAPPAAPRRWPPVCDAAGGDRFMTEAQRVLIRERLGCGPEELALRFESLGRNCEFGFVQTMLGATPLGLLRFNFCELQPLLEGLECGFEDIDDPALSGLDIQHTVEPEYFFVNRRYRSILHTQRFVAGNDEANVLAEMRRLLAFLKIKFLRTLADADRIFVCQRPGHVPVARMRPLLARLRAYGANRLLFVTEGGPRRPGVLDDLGGGLMHGAIDRLAHSSTVHCCNHAAWVSLCVNACLATAETVQS